MKILVYKEICQGPVYIKTKNTMLGTCSCGSTNLRRVETSKNADEIKSYSFYLCEANCLHSWPTDMIAKEMTD